MNISEVELKTGITKQNIRFYEKKGLLHPRRNKENSYREYTEEDVETLKKIKIFRRLDVSIEDIHRIFKGESLNDILKVHLDYLLSRQSDLEAAISMCRFILQTQADSIDVGLINCKMEDMERKGGRFMGIINDYKKVSAAERKKAFYFVPDNMALTPEEFTESLCQYGMEQNLNLVVTQEGMNPKFEIDGLEYEAYREWGRYGAIIKCKATHPELVEEEYKNVPEKNKGILRTIYYFGLFLFIPVCLFAYFWISSGKISLAVYLELFYLCVFFFLFRHFRLR